MFEYCASTWPGKPWILAAMALMVPQLHPKGEEAGDGGGEVHNARDHPDHKPGLWSVVALALGKVTDGLPSKLRGYLPNAKVGKNPG